MRWLVIAVVAFVLFKLVANEIRKRAERPGEAKTSPAETAKGAELSKDPVCGAYVAVASSISVRDGETVHRFCSYECRDAYLEQLRGTGREIPNRKDPEDE